MSIEDFDTMIRRPGYNRMELARRLWPEAKSDQSRRVMIGNWITKGIKTIRVNQIEVLKDFFHEKTD